MLPRLKVPKQLSQRNSALGSIQQPLTQRTHIGTQPVGHQSSICTHKSPPESLTNGSRLYLEVFQIR
jgi:hypothetical protein